MFKYLAIIMLSLLFPASAFAAKEEAPPLDPAYEGEHGMVLVGNGANLYVSHLASYRAPSNVQLIYSVDSKSLPLINLVRDAEVVTLKPKSFNLQRLIRGEALDIVADVYMGHYQRGGLLTFKDMSISLETQLYLRVLDQMEKSHIRHKYDSIELANNQRLLVHQIQTAPSYDQLLMLFDNVSCVTEFATQSAVPSPNEIYRKLAFCGSIKPLYYDSENFQQ